MSTLTKYAAGATGCHPNANLRQSDLGAVLVLTVVLVMIAAASPTLPSDLQQDNLQYLKIARDVAAYRDVPGIYAQRIVPCAIVWGAKVLGLCDVITGFRVLSTVAITTFLFGIYFCYRRFGLVPAVAASATVFVLIGSWPIVYGLSNVYQACDTLAYPLALAFIISVRARLYWPAVLVGAVGLGADSSCWFLRCSATSRLGQKHVRFGGWLPVVCTWRSSDCWWGPPVSRARWD
jgi:hypothetical protein